MLMHTPEARLDGLRTELDKRGLDGFVVPISDEHMSEYVGDYAQRLRWLTGFGGSAGSAVVLRDKAAIFTDGRYTVQVREQVPAALYSYEDVPATSPARWIAANAPRGARIGYDAWLHGVEWVEAATKTLAAKGIELIATQGNPIDAVWADQPEPSDAVAVPHDDALAGRSSADKRQTIADQLKEEGYDAVVVTALDSVAWALNMRGADIANTPVALANLVVRDDATAQLFVADGKVGPELSRHFGNAVSVLPAEQFEPELEALKGKRVAIDPSRTVAAIAQALERGGAQVERSADPTLLPKAIKTQAEQQGQRDAQAVDGVAIVRFLMWIEANAPSGKIDELTAAAKLREFRGLNEELKDGSFDTISAAGPHAALPHYKVDETSNIPIPPSSIYLCDSGGQYTNGTTDITRTVWIGPGDPTHEMVDRNTRVLKGHIELALATFPAGSNGGQLDTLARMHLWQAGVDYGHGTGHGVGSYLSVHEGPQRISKPGGAFAGTGTPLEPGMILSNEPGYYKQGAFGIRIENLVLVVPAQIDNDVGGAEGDWLGFETLTFAPLDRRLVDANMLTTRERTWWNAYHVDVLRIVGPGLDGPEREWLEEQCRPL